MALADVTVLANVMVLAIANTGGLTTISAKFHNPGIPEILGIPGFRAVSQFLRCF